MKKLMIVLSVVYVFNITGCSTFDMAKEEENYQNKVHQEKLDKMAGKPLNCQQTSSVATIRDEHGKIIPKPNFTYTTPTGQPCLP